MKPFSETRPVFYFRVGKYAFSVQKVLRESSELKDAIVWIEESRGTK